MMTAEDGSRDGRQERRRERARAFARVASLDVLVGAHPDALHDIYGSGEPLDPTRVDAAPGRLLAVEPLANTFMLTKPLVALASKLDPWRGKAFERGGTAGKDLVLNLRAFRFRCEVGPSALDGDDTLLIGYAGLGNPWPISLASAEVRRVGATAAIGPAFLGDRLLGWWGLEVEEL